MLRQQQQGFTLIEVLIALIICAIALTALGLAMHRVILHTRQLQQRITAHWVAMNVMNDAQIGLLSLPKTTSTMSGDRMVLRQRWHWRLQMVNSQREYAQSVMITVWQQPQHILSQINGFIVKQSVEDADEST